MLMLLLLLSLLASNCSVMGTLNFILYHVRLFLLSKTNVRVSVFPLYPLKVNIKIKRMHFGQ